MGNGKHFAIYWDDEKHLDLMEKLGILAAKQERSKSATALVALKEYVEKYWVEEESDGK